ncbi:unnamed protein product [Notodromas monacha]|uniref:Uncharacterized protein n=1 Tax=Notodromas monacha TaxID=399045 RepID=A0A7R9BTM8_9CRUS|nr:unnamed protein product [Notodromas monacha]CAG0921533.1 unnamed protein product [Notodromas monacha]
MDQNNIVERLVLDEVPRVWEMASGINVIKETSRRRHLIRGLSGEDSIRTNDDDEGVTRSKASRYRHHLSCSGTNSDVFEPQKNGCVSPRYEKINDLMISMRELREAEKICRSRLQHEKLRRDRSVRSSEKRGSVFSVTRGTSPDSRGPLASDEAMAVNWASTLFASCYFVLAILVTSVAVVVTELRVPDPKKYPPLPDIILENLRFIPWGLKAAEFAIMTLFLLFGFIFYIHKHRDIILRRFFVIAGTGYFYRSLTMVVTSLSVPSPHLKSCYKLPSFPLRILEINVEFMPRVASRSSNVIPPFSSTAAFTAAKVAANVAAVKAAVDENGGITLDNLEATLGMNATFFSRILRGNLGYNKKGRLIF